MNGTKHLIAEAIRLMKNKAQRVKKFYMPCSVHCECIYDDVVWEKIKEFIEREKGTVFFCLTPINFNYVKGSFGISISKKNYAQVLKKRYRYLQERGHRIELHVHTGLLTYKWDYKKTKKLIEDAYNWMVENGFKPTEFVPGWWSYSKNTRKSVADIGLKLVTYNDYCYLHDYQL